ncbi:MAG TPA: excinuclease ABC subunit UvrC [Planctomycetes bacterium]|nr:excinuclease ABC subunit UvrC [Planctomycetota bacterium]
MSIHPWPDTDLGVLKGRAGVYLFRDAEGRVLYVGKSRDLKSRLSTYRAPGGDGRIGVRFLERDAKSVETILTRTEAEALLLEDSLIKEHRPPHNVRLKDDKSFLMIRIDEERFPRLKFVRAHNPKAGKKGGRSRFFGPFASSRAVRRTLSDLHRVVPLRDCADSVLEHRTRPCLKHQIGLCSAPCVGKIDEKEYGRLVERAVRILSGDTSELETDLERRMRTASEAREYELAALWRDRLAALRRTVEGQGVSPRSRQERDVLGLARSGEDALVHRLAFRGGRLAESRSHLFRSELPDEELLHVVLTALFASGRREAPREVLVPCLPTELELVEAALGGSTRIAVPRGGEGRRMLELAGENARGELLRLCAKRGAGEQAAAGLARLVGLGEDREHLVVDCFDISNFQGSNVVASRVRFRGGVADRAGYRRFRVKTVEGQDDFAAMGEVVGRSLRRGVREGDLPDLVVIDGGAAQLQRALEARDDAGAFEVALISLAKARSERTRNGKRIAKSEERVYLSPDTEPIELPRHSDVRHLLERVRDEAHRFAITYHRKERGRIRSRLDSIPGVGPAKRKELLRRFGSVVGVARASVEELGAVPGISAELANRICEHLRERPS